MPARPSLFLLVVWAGAAGLAVGVATAGVNLVARQVTAPLPLVLDDASVTPEVTATPSIEDTPSGASPSVSSSGTSGSSGSSTSGTSGPSASPPSSPTPAPSPSPSTSPSPSASASEDDDDEVGDETRTVTSVGGQASFRFLDGTVELLWATPASGFTAAILEQRSDRVILEFRSSSHVSEIEARWSDGAPRTEVDEDSEGSSEGGGDDD